MKQFKQFCKESERKFRSKLTKKLLSIETNKPSEFWNLVKQMRNWGSDKTETSDSIHPNDWLNHFQKLLNEVGT